MAKNTISPYIKALKFTLLHSVLVYLCSAVYTWSFTIPINNVTAPGYGWVRLFMMICEICFYALLVYYYETNKPIDVDLKFREFTPRFSYGSFRDRANEPELRHLCCDNNISHENNDSSVKVFYSDNMVIITDIEKISSNTLSKILIEDEQPTT